jgi:prolipoprotein diacylglyceryltransferase
MRRPQTQTPHQGESQGFTSYAFASAQRAIALGCLDRDQTQPNWQNKETKIHLSISRFLMSRFSLPQHAFKYCGCLGLILGGPLSVYLAFRQGLSPWFETCVITVAVGMLLATPLAVKVLTGRDGFVFYRDVICIFVAVTLTLRWLHQPILSYLDVTIVGSGLFHACGRIGCLLSGCCYGRPSRVGVRYTHAHAQMGFPLLLTGVRLFPIQAVESAWILCLSSNAAWMVLRHSQPGTAFAAYVGGYALGRFLLEFARGDAARPYFLGFSQAQWISFFLALGVGLLAQSGFTPHSILWAGPVTVLVGSAALVALVRKVENPSRFELLHPRHTEEIAELVRRPGFPGDAHQPPLRTSPRLAIKVTQTSLGVRISAGEIPQDGAKLRHYCLSKEGQPLSRRGSNLLARQISLMLHDGAPFRSMRGANGVIHLLF